MEGQSDRAARWTAHENARRDRIRDTIGSSLPSPAANGSIETLNRLKSVAGTAALFCALATGAQAAPGMPQYVIVSFDGAQHIEQWERSRELARRTGASFTYFLSCVYLLGPETRQGYKGPHRGAGRSNVGFAASRDEVAARLGQIWQARQEGHEIANHGCGHFDGGEWSKADWLSEFSQFDRILREAYSANGIEGEPQGWRAMVENDIRGFRAPYLSTSDALFSALREHGLRYDASTVSRGPAKPSGKDVIRFALPLIPEGPAQRLVIAMDYNLFVRHSGGFENTSQGEIFTQRTVDAFAAAFEREYAGDRTPLQIGFHFTLMNGGAYWDALERFATDVCARADVRCVSYERYLAEALPGD